MAVIISLASHFFIHKYPLTAPFLPEPERAFTHARLKGDSDAINNEAFAWSNVRDALGDYKYWFYGLGFHTMSLSSLHALSILTNRY